MIGLPGGIERVFSSPLPQNLSEGKTAESRRHATATPQRRVFAGATW